MIAWPESLVRDIARRRVVLFIGSGVSRHSLDRLGVRSPPTWEGFLKTAIDRCEGNVSHIRKAIRERKYLAACDWIKRRLDDEWRTLLQAEFMTPGFSHAKIHSLIYQLDCRFVLTPNFDTIYENYCISESSGTVVIKNYYDEDISSVLRENQRAILKIHGSVTQADKIVFTEKQYAEVRTKHSNFYKIVDALIATNTLVFIGCGIDDPDIQLALENSAFSGITPPHFIILPKPVHDDLSMSIKESRNLKALTYKKTDDHQVLVDSLAELVSLVSNYRDTIAREQSW